MAKTPTGGKAAKISLPTNLSYRRSIDVSEGYLYSVAKDDKGAEKLVPVPVDTTTVRGAIAPYNAGYGKNGTALQGEALSKAQNPAKPNIQSIDRAALAPESDTLSLRFSVAFHAASLRPDACADGSYMEQIRLFQKAALAAGLHRDLAGRYLWNLVNGRVLWRNGATGIPATSTVTDVSDQAKPVKLSFNWGALSQDKFPGLAALEAAAPGSGKGEVEQLVEKISGALSGTGPDLLPLDVDIRTRLYRGAEVWPSQEFVEKSQKIRDGREISRILSSRPMAAYKDFPGMRHATMHSQKIGNAVRTVDEWHGDEGYGAIPVEAFGWVQRDLVAIRKPDQRADAYAAFSDIAATSAELASVSGRERGLYTLAMLIRGGVYGVSGKGGEETTTEPTGD